MQLAEMIETLRDPACFGKQGGAVQVIQTHISVVFLTRQFAYKLKKPVQFEFLDFSTLAARRAACHEELRLNRRLAKEIYLDVVPLVELPGGSLRVGESGDSAGQVVDYLVKMRLLPTEQCLDRLIELDRVRPENCAAIAALLADFYATATPIAIGRREYREHIERHVRANRDDLLAAAQSKFVAMGAGDTVEGLDAAAVRRVHAAQLQFLRLSPAVFDARVAAGRVVDGHGDLRPEHICLIDPPVVFDCLEFSAELRQIDSADELAFLQMECEALGAAEVGGAVVAAFEAASGDRAPEALRHFYISYRACVRAKVAALRARQLTDVRTSQADANDGTGTAGLVVEAWSQAGRYVMLADAHTGHFARPVLVVVSGLMGSGKSTLARGLADALGADLLQTDIVRQELFGPGPSAAGFGEDIYDAEHRAAVYRELLARAGSLVARGQSAVLDGAFLTDSVRREALGLAGQSYQALLVDCRCPAEEARRRIAERLARGGDASAARPELHALQQQRAEPIAGDLAFAAVDTTLPLDEQITAVCHRLAEV